MGFNRGITIGADYSTPEAIMRSVDRLTPAQRAAVLATLFPGVLPPQRRSHQAIGALEDVDGDGTPENVLDQWLPLSNAAGLSMAAGDIAEVDITPQRLFKPGILSVVGADDVIVTAFTIGIEPQFVASGAVPLAAFAPEATYKLLSSHWAGPGVPVKMSLKNTHASAARKVYGVWFGDTVVRSG